MSDTPGQLLLEHFHGAATRVGATDTAFPHRAEGYNLLVLAESMYPADTDLCTAWAKQTYTQMEPFFASGPANTVWSSGSAAVMSR